MVPEMLSAAGSCRCSIVLQMLSGAADIEWFLGAGENATFDRGDQARNESQVRSLEEILSSRSCPNDLESCLQDYDTLKTGYTS